MLVAMVLYVSLAFCSLLAALMVCRYDLYDREPWYMLVLAAVLGAITMYGAGELQVAALAALGNTAAAYWNTSISFAAATTEEFAKLAVVFAIAAVFPRMFNDPMDGIIYGSFAGLGAAIEESVSLMGPSVRLWEMLPAQEPVRLMGHLVMGGIGGFGVGMLRPERRRLWLLALLIAWTLAFTLHFVWDIVAFSAADLGRMLPWHKGAAVTVMVGGLVVYWRLVAVAEVRSREWFGIAADRAAGAVRADSSAVSS